MPDRDPIRELENFPTEGTAMNPLEPSEVRRQGDALRRRRTLTGVVCAVAAVAIIAGGGFAVANLTGGDDDPGPGPAASSDNSSSDPTSPSESTSSDPAEPYTQEPTDLPTDVPASVDLTTGWPALTESGGNNRLQRPSAKLPAIEHTACGKQPVGAPDPETRLTTYRAQPEDYRSRELQVFADIDTAEAYVKALRKLYADCPREQFDTVTMVTEVRDLENGDEAFDAASRAEANGAPAVGVNLVKVVRVGNAVLVDTGSTEGTTTGPLVVEHGRQLVTLVEELCVYDPIGCDGNG